MSEITLGTGMNPLVNQADKNNFLQGTYILMGGGDIQIFSYTLC